MAKRKESATVDLKIRMKEPLRALIEESAKRRGVSMNAEMVARLQGSFARDAERNEREELRARLDRIDDFMRKMAGMKEMEDAHPGQELVMGRWQPRAAWELYVDDNGEYRWRRGAGRTPDADDDEEAARRFMAAIQEILSEDEKKEAS